MSEDKLDEELKDEDFEVEEVPKEEESFVNEGSLYMEESKLLLISV